MMSWKKQWRLKKCTEQTAHTSSRACLVFLDWRHHARLRDASVLFVPRITSTPSARGRFQADERTTRVSEPNPVSRIRPAQKRKRV
jgi:hypothetical protein